MIEVETKQYSGVCGYFCECIQTYNNVEDLTKDLIWNSDNIEDELGYDNLTSTDGVYVKYISGDKKILLSAIEEARKSVIVYEE